jgi:hypothetical protein
MNKGNGLKALNIIHKALLMGPIIFGAICFYLVYNGMGIIADETFNRTLQVIAIAIAAAGFFIGTALFKKKLAVIKTTDDAAQKFNLYRAACILQWALLEGPSLFCIISFFITGNYAFLVLAGALIILFAMMAPTKIKVAFQTGLTEDELDEL